MPAAASFFNTVSAARMERTAAAESVSSSSFFCYISTILSI